MMKTLILSSSLSDNSKSFILCNETFKALSKNGVTCKIIDARDIKIRATHNEKTDGMKALIEEIKKSDNIIIGMGVHCYSINDSLKIILDTCFSEADGKFYGILCAAGGNKGFLSTMHLTQICMNEWRMIQLPRTVFAISNDFNGNKIISKDLVERINIFAEEFESIGMKLLS